MRIERWSKRSASRGCDFRNSGLSQVFRFMWSNELALSETMAIKDMIISEKQIVLKGAVLCKRI